LAARGAEPLNATRLRACLTATLLAETALKLSLLAGPRFAMPIFGSAAVPVGTAIVVAPAGIASAYDGVPSTEFAQETAIHLESANPQPIGRDDGVAAPSISAFQTDVVVVKTRLNAAWAAVPGAVQFFEDVQ
jgi:hypothetical protein